MTYHETLDTRFILEFVLWRSYFNLKIILKFMPFPKAYSMKTINVIGAGKLGLTLARLWQLKKVFVVQNLMSREFSHAQKAAHLVTGATAVESWGELQSADFWLLSTVDSQIVSVAQNLAKSGLLRGGDVVFHCSGVLSSADLRSQLPEQVLVGSVHPLKSFAQANVAFDTLGGTFCVQEGDRAALELLGPAFEKIGALIRSIDPQSKVLYHTASVMVCNYVTALMEAGLLCFEKAGLSREAVYPMIEPLVRETVNNVFKYSTTQALTGPIARGDVDAVKMHVKALDTMPAPVKDIYCQLGLLAVDLSRAQARASEADLGRITQVLSA